jgi:hypothetical protein
MRKQKLVPILFGNQGPEILLSGDRTATDISAAGTLIGTLSVRNGRGVYTFTEDDDPNELFQVDGNDLEQDGTFDAGVYDPTTTVTIMADNSVDPPITQQFVITLIETVVPDADLIFGTLDAAVI